MWKYREVELREEELDIQSAELGEESSVPDLLGETVLQNNLEFCLDEDDEIFEGYGRRENSYPYRQFNGYGNELKQKKVKSMVLENQYLKAVFLPEYGGRLWSLLDKETGKNLLYTNDVLQFRNLAVRNAWFSGGVEWNIGVIGHTPLTTAQLYTAVLTGDSGVPVLRMYEYERIRRVFYQMDFWLEEEEKMLNCRMRIVNENQEVVPMYWWSNMAVPEFEGGRILVPAEKAYTYADGKITKVKIPVVDGTDITRYNNIPKSVDYFFAIEEESPKYIANLDKEGYGLLQVSTKRLKSRKLFSWGHSPASERWQAFLTKEAGDYVEIQAGLAKTQYGCLPMAPHTAWEWMEQYGPVRLSGEQMEKPHEETSGLLTEKLISEHRFSKLEQKLKDSKKFARSKGILLMKGSGYGAFVAQKNGTEHLEFTVEKEGQKAWADFKQTSLLHSPSPKDRPDEFWDEEDIFCLLKKSVKTENRENWYAHYQLGICFCSRKEYEKAEEELKISYELEPNPWACHGLGCAAYACSKKAEAVAWIRKGIQIRMQDISYLKEGFKLMYLSEGYKELTECYERLGKAERKISRLRFYDIAAKAKLGLAKEAYEQLEKDGGLELEDIREGEDSIELLWKQLNMELFGEEKEVPRRYCFKSF